MRRSLAEQQVLARVWNSGDRNWGSNTRRMGPLPRADEVHCRYKNGWQTDKVQIGVYTDGIAAVPLG